MPTIDITADTTEEVISSTMIQAVREGQYTAIMLEVTSGDIRFHSDEENARAGMPRANGDVMLLGTFLRDRYFAFADNSAAATVEVNGITFGPLDVERQ